jgi:hypothetical protein
VVSIDQRDCYGSDHIVFVESAIVQIAEYTFFRKVLFAVIQVALQSHIIDGDIAGLVRVDHRKDLRLGTEQKLVIEQDPIVIGKTYYPQSSRFVSFVKAGLGSDREKGINSGSQPFVKE